MPTLHWIGKDKIINHHQEVPYKILDKQYTFTNGKADKEAESENKIIHGDNLEALKSLLPEYEGKVKCIYIDPPYNTGNEGWVYNDNVSHPKLKKWLGEVVGKEDDDLTRDDKWLCMMYPRLKLLYKLLSNQGTIWISIDDNSAHILKLVLDEIFGKKGFIACNVWQKRYSRENRGAIGDAHEYIFVYSKDPEDFKKNRNKLPLTEKQAKIYKNPTNDPRGRWRTIPMTAQGFRPNQMYEIAGPDGTVHVPPEGRCWSTIEENYLKLYLPPNLKDEDKEAIVVNYLDHADANLNYVRLAINSRHIKLSDRTRLKAKRLGARLNNEILEEGMSWTEGIEVSIAEDQVEPFVFSIEKHRRKYSYSRKWLNLTRSPRMIFKNFSTFFGFINSQGCIDLVSKNCEMDTFETIAMRSKNEYFYYSGFHQKSLRSDLQLLIYLDYLKHYNIRLESILEFIVNNYLNTEYGINDLKISLPSENATILEKIRMLAPELENLVRQYQFYIEEGFIDNELLELSSSFIYFGTVPSAVNWKYAYGCGNDFKRLKNDFFSSQSMLGYVKRNKGKYRNLFLLLNSEDINYDEFKGFQKSEIDFLVSKEILLIDDEGIVEIKNKAFLEVLSILHYEEVINFWHHTEDMQKEILKMEKNGLVVLEKKLFTTEERRYLNFYLNKKEFTNGLDLRNKYLHGTNSSSTDEHEKDYYILLKLLILVIHKIEDDLSLRKRLLTA